MMVAGVAVERSAARLVVDHVSPPVVAAAPPERVIAALPVVKDSEDAAVPVVKNVGTPEPVDTTGAEVPRGSETAVPFWGQGRAEVK